GPRRLRGGPPPMTLARRDELHANNQCYICEQGGHLARDCPRRKTIKPLEVQSAALHLHRLAEQGREEISLQLNAIEMSPGMAETEINAMSPHEILSNDIPQHFYDCVCILMAYKMYV
ncbi:hypothetical protein JB92DRAFT_2729698, partial [Gautieria morchelliformis]